MEFLIKNGSKRIIQDLKDDIFKIRTLQDCNYHVDGIDKCRGIRETAKAIVDLVSDPSRLDEEREFMRKNREKFDSMRTTDGSDAIGGSSSGVGQYDYKNTQMSMGSKEVSKKVITDKI
jgi:hypothetical protein